MPSGQIARLELAALTWSLRVLDKVQNSMRQTRRHRALLLAHEPCDDDIFIVSYPKAGTTAVQMMVYQMAGEGGCEFSHISSVVPWFEVDTLRGTLASPETGSPRIYKTHLSFRELPRKGRFIYLLRNPKDTCVSYYYHTINNQGARPTMRAFAQRFVLGEVTWGSWFQHVLDAADSMRDRRVLIVNYDDIATRPESVLDRISEFCGYRLDASKRDAVLYYCSFAFMKANTSKFDPSLATGPIPRSDFVRAGLVGNWVKELSPAMAGVLDEALMKTMATLPVAKREIFTDCLRSGLSPLRGTVSAVVEDVGALSERGGVMRVDDESLKVGDLIRVNLSDRQGGRLIVEQAKVFSLQRHNGETIADVRWD